jgi:putative DNA primase/helicase
MSIAAQLSNPIIYSRRGNLERALALAELGLAIFPCRPREEVDPTTGEVLKAKSPLTPHGFKDATADEDVIRFWWKRWPDALPAIPTGKINKLVVADLDRKNGKDGIAALEKIGLTLPDTHIQSTPTGGEHRFFYYPADVEKIASGSDLFKNLLGSKETGIDVRGDGGYVIAWGDLNEQNLSEFARWPTKSFADAFRRDEEAGRIRHERRQEPQQGRAPRADDLAKAKVAVEFIPAEDYGDWVKVGMALKSAFGESGRETWDLWSKKSAKFEASGQDKKWRSFNGAGIGLGTLFDLAKRYGYRPNGKDNFSCFSNFSFSEPTKNENGAWGEPEPLSSRIEAWPYPIDAFPADIRNAIKEAHEIIKLPVEIAGNCALSSLSIAAQALADVKRMPGLTGPVCLFLLALAESGDRKSTCDKWFTAAIRAYENEQEEEFEPALKEYRAAFKAWKAEGSGIEAAISAASKKGDPTASLHKKLSDHEWDEPQEPRVPSLIRAGDDSSEQLAFSLAKKWPSAGTISAEAGSVFGGHAMGEGKIMRNLALQNVIWDGGSHQVGRRTSECFVVRGARLTIGLQAQEQVLREFCNQYGSLARGIGFFARFLFAWPQSMQGERLISNLPPEAPPAATAFNRRLSELINLPVSMGADGALTPILLDMTDEARDAWVETHNGIERELRPFGDLKEIPDVASKAADNVARIAALFHLYQHGPTGRIDADTILSAAKILLWHLNEARRFLGAFSMAPELADAARVEEWLIKHCRIQGKGANVVLRSTLQQRGPYGVRKKKDLDAALDELVNLNHVHLISNGKKREIHVNPTLLEVK